MKPFSEWDFTLQKYVRLCRTILNSRYKVLTVNDYLANQKDFIPERFVILRHDVDRKPFHALKMAQVESELRICSTYYFRTKACSFHPEVIEKIALLGHEVGYHYENLSDMRGNMELAIRDFENNLKKFTSLVPVRTICMHGSPLSRWNNRDLWNKYDFADFGLMGEPYLSIDYSDTVYLSDTGRTWDPDKFTVRDKVISKVKLKVDSTMDVMGVLRSKNYTKLHILTHPERWSLNIPDFFGQCVRDNLGNISKWILH